MTLPPPPFGPDERGRLRSGKMVVVGAVVVAITLLLLAAFFFMGALP